MCTIVVIQREVYRSRMRAILERATKRVNLRSFWVQYLDFSILKDTTYCIAIKETCTNTAVAKHYFNKGPPKHLKEMHVLTAAI